MKPKNIDDLVTCNCLMSVMSIGYNFNQTKQTLLNGMKEEDKSKMNKYLDDLFYTYIKPIEQFSKYDEMDIVPVLESVITF